MSNLLPRISFTQALADTEDQRRNLLLGNGFSIAADKKFAYGSLYSIAVERDDGIADLFDYLDTENFEVALQDVSDPDDAARLRSALYDAVASVHPSWGDVGRAAIRTCGEFLEDFTGLRRGSKRGKVFSTNYDLLLYWVLAAHTKALKCHDGFHEFVWDEGRDDWTFVYYLHGTLYIREAPMGVSGRKRQIQKLRSSPEAPLLPQIRAYLQRGDYPLLISEAIADHKQALIGRNKYLANARDAFQTACEVDDSALFVIGHGLGDMDSHITDAIAGGRVNSVYVSIYLPEDEEITFVSEGENRAAIIASEWAQTRKTNGGPSLNVSTFFVHECPIWGPCAEGT